MSGGQRQRVMIAMALANDPDILIADEPTTALDVTIQAQILMLIAELQRKLGMAMILITHDLGLVRRMPTGSMSCGRARSSRSGTEAHLRNPQHAYTRMLLAAEPTGRKAPPPMMRPCCSKRGMSRQFMIWRRLSVSRARPLMLRAVDGTI
jgi:oligopeptide transport system ATP-binding protein